MGGSDLVRSAGSCGFSRWCLAQHFDHRAKVQFVVGHNREPRSTIVGAGPGTRGTDFPLRPATPMIEASPRDGDVAKGPLACATTKSKRMQLAIAAAYRQAGGASGKCLPSHLRPVDRHPRRCPEPPVALAHTIFRTGGWTRPRCRCGAVRVAAVDDALQPCSRSSECRAGRCSWRSVHMTHALKSVAAFCSEGQTGNGLMQQVYGRWHCSRWWSVQLQVLYRERWIDGCHGAQRIPSLSFHARAIRANSCRRATSLFGGTFSLQNDCLHWWDSGVSGHGPHLEGRE